MWILFAILKVAHCYTWLLTTKNAEAVRKLIALGANINILTVDDETPLFDAVFFDFEVGVKLLLNAGADPTIANFINQTPLDVARSQKFKFIAKILTQE